MGGVGATSSGTPSRIRECMTMTILEIVRHLRSPRAATAIEYGLIAALIAVAAIAAMQGLGNNLKNTFNNVSSNLKTA